MVVGVLQGEGYGVGRLISCCDNGRDGDNGVPLILDHQPALEDLRGTVMEQEMFTTGCVRGGTRWR